MTISKIYILALNNDKFYIGKTNSDVEERFNQHLKGGGSSWTSKYKPLKIIDSYQSECNFEEDKKTKEYMIKYGIENVRGGTYCKIELFDWQIKCLQQEFKSIEIRCYKCNKIGHFVEDCDKITKTLENENKYLAQFTNIPEILEEIKLLEEFLKNIKQINLKIKNYCIFTDCEVECEENRGRIYFTDIRPLGKLIITNTQIKEVLDYLDSLLENKNPIKDFNSIFENKENVNYLQILGVHSSQIHTFLKNKNMIINSKRDFIKKIHQSVETRTRIKFYLDEINQKFKTNFNYKEDINFDKVITFLENKIELFMIKSYEKFYEVE